jgi:uncharacterized protein YijF (DUF1287 family)
MSYPGAEVARLFGVTTSAVVRAAYSEDLSEIQKYLISPLRDYFSALRALFATRIWSLGRGRSFAFSLTIFVLK